jgi:hypothetical protein
VSRENVELARRGYDALASGDMEAVLAGLDPAIVIRPPGEVMGEELYYGHAGF